MNRRLPSLVLLTAVLLSASCSTGVENRRYSKEEQAFIGRGVEGMGSGFEHLSGAERIKANELMAILFIANSDVDAFITQVEKRCPNLDMGRSSVSETISSEFQILFIDFEPRRNSMVVYYDRETRRILSYYFHIQGW